MIRYICGMKECLQCQGQFKSKSATVKFCSTKCRVKYHRKHPKQNKETITDLNIRVLYNQMLEWMSKPNFIPPTHPAYEGTKTTYEPMFTPKPPTTKKTPDQWVAEKREIADGNMEEYTKWLTNLDASDLHPTIKKQIKFA